MGSFFLIASLALLGALGVLVWRALQISKLARYGVPITGTVVRMVKTRSKTGRRGERVVFTYDGPDGRSYRRSSGIVSSRSGKLQEGDLIKLYFLPDHPGTSAPAWLVEEARKAIRK